MPTNNPTGINGHKDCPPKTDKDVEEIICGYHRNGVTSRTTVSELLRAEHGIIMGEATVARRFKAFGLMCSNKTMKALPGGQIQARQLVFDAMAEDPTRQKGPNSIKEAIAHKTSLHLPRDFIRDEMRLQDPEGFSRREPGANKIIRGVLRSLGPNHEWSADGHDKLVALGFAIWGIRDKWSGKWLGLWVLPNNRYKDSIAFLYLKLVAELRGMPIQSTTDCGSETTLLYGLASALREAFAPALSETGMGPAHVFVKSVYNITIERGWLRLRLTWIDNVKIFFATGTDSGIYDPAIPQQYELVQWLWPKLLQQELDTFKELQNAHRVRRDSDKMNPSGVAPNVAYSLFEKYGGQQCLEEVDVDVVHNIMTGLGGEALIQFVTPEYAYHCQEVYDGLHIDRLEFGNVWEVYRAMLPLL